MQVAWRPVLVPNPNFSVVQLSGAQAPQQQMQMQMQLAPAPDGSTMGLASPGGMVPAALPSPGGGMAMGLPSPGGVAPVGMAAPDGSTAEAAANGEANGANGDAAADPDAAANGLKPVVAQPMMVAPAQLQQGGLLQMPVLAPPGAQPGRPVVVHAAARPQLAGVVQSGGMQVAGMPAGMQVAGMPAGTMQMVGSQMVGGQMVGGQMVGGMGMPFMRGPGMLLPSRRRGAHGKQGWTREEDQQILHHVQMTGQKWSAIAEALPGRTDDAVRNRYLRLMKKATRKGVGEGGLTSAHLADCASVKNGDMWTAEEDTLIMDGVMRIGQKWQQISELLPGRSANAVRNRYLRCEGTQGIPGQPGAMLQDDGNGNLILAPSTGLQMQAMQGMQYVQMAGGQMQAIQADGLGLPQLQAQGMQAMQGAQAMQAQAAQLQAAGLQLQAAGLQQAGLLQQAQLQAAQLSAGMMQPGMVMAMAPAPADPNATAAGGADSAEQMPPVAPAVQAPPAV